MLMSTYNGEKFIKTQIESILNQKDVKVDLLVRDDGSSDNTCAILQNYKAEGLIEWYNGENLGSAKSFWDLLLKAPKSKYYAFADQDDYWLEDKLYRAISVIKSDGDIGSKLYFSKKTIVNEDLEGIDVQDEPVRGVGLEYSLIRGFAAGCTMLFNEELYKKLIEYTPKVMTMHDSWILKVAGAIGKVIYDNESRILYRQHSNNAIGNQTRYKAFVRHISSISKLKNDDTRIIMAKQLVDYYSEMMSAKDVYFTKLLSDARNSFISRIKMILTNYYQTQIKSDILSFKILILLGWI